MRDHLKIEKRSIVLKTTITPPTAVYNPADNFATPVIEMQMIPKTTITCIALAFVFASTSALATPQAGTLDTSFGNAGLATFLPEDNLSIGVSAIAVDSEDRILLAGHSETPFQFLTDFILLRFDDAGDPDSDFGAFQQFNQNGYVIVPWGPNSYDQSNGVAVQSDGRIVLSGTGDVARFFVLGGFGGNDGSFDASFGDGDFSVLGYPLITETNPSGQGRSQAMLVDPSDRILVVGNADGQLAALRVTPDGDVYDTSFDSDGTAFFDEFVSAFDRPVDVDLLPSGEIVVAVNNPQSGNQSGYLFLLSDSGQLLPFGDDDGNIATISALSENHVIRDLVVTNDRIYVCGSSGMLSTGDDISGFVACFELNGQLDSEFSDDGVFTFDTAGKNTQLTIIDVENNGRIVVAGSQADDGTFAYEPFAMRLKANGRLDVGYGNSGSQLFSGISGFAVAGTTGGGQDLFITGIFASSYGIVKIQGGLDFVLGDVNVDQVVNLLDVGPFVGAISSSNYVPAADINCDNSVDLLDVGPFVELLGGN